MAILEKIKETHTWSGIIMTTMLLFTGLLVLTAEGARENFLQSFFILGIPITVFSWIAATLTDEKRSEWYMVMFKWVLPMVVVLLFTPTEHSSFNFGIEHPIVAIPLALLFGLRASAFFVNDAKKPVKTN